MRTIKLFSILMFLICPSIGQPQSNFVAWSTFDMGYGRSSSATSSLTSIVGQPFVGESSILQSGFLFNPVLDVKDRGILLPLKYSLVQNYPNPFNPSTTIRYELPKASRVELIVYNVLGQSVATLLDAQQEAGIHQLTFDATRLPSGVYFYRIRAGTFVDTKKLVLLR